MRAALLKLHRWLGFSLGGLFALLGLTGSLLVFYTEIDRQVHPSIQVERRAPDWDMAVRTLRLRYPEKRGAWRIEVTDDGAIPVRYNKPPETEGRTFAPMMVWLSPDGRQVLRRDYWGNYAMTWLYDLHYQLLLGKAGSFIVGLIGLMLIVVLVGGLLIWWPRGRLRKALRYKARGVPARRWRDQHKLAGLASFAFLTLLAGTGAMLALPGQTAHILEKLGAPRGNATAPVSAKWTGRQIHTSQAIAIAQATLPYAKIAWIEIPGPGNDAFRLRMQVSGDPGRRFPQSYVWIDQYSGTVLRVDDIRVAGRGDRIFAWLHPLHDGSAGGMPLRLLWAAIGIAPSFLLLTAVRRANVSRRIGRRPQLFWKNGAA